MIAKLEFNLPEDRDEFKMASDGMAWGLLMWELFYDRSSPLSEDETPESAEELRQAIFDFINDYMQEHGLVLPT